MADQGSSSFYRASITLLLVVSLFVTLSWLQGRFDSSDNRKAEEIVTSYRVEGGRSLAEAIVARHPGSDVKDIHYRTEIRSGCLGYVRVFTSVADSEYAFDVNLNDPSVHPTDPRTREILMSLTSSTSTTTKR